MFDLCLDLKGQYYLKSGLVENISTVNILPDVDSALREPQRVMLSNVSPATPTLTCTLHLAQLFLIFLSASRSVQNQNSAELLVSCQDLFSSFLSFFIFGKWWFDIHVSIVFVKVLMIFLIWFSLRQSVVFLLHTPLFYHAHPHLILSRRKCWLFGFNLHIPNEMVYFSISALLPVHMCSVPLLASNPHEVHFFFLLPWQCFVIKLNLKILMSLS